MLPALRDDRGRPTVLVRLLGVLVTFGMVALAAPAVIPVVRWIVDALV